MNTARPATVWTRYSARRVALTEDEIESLIAFVRDELLDPGARPERLRRLTREKLPSGRAGLVCQR